MAVMTPFFDIVAGVAILAGRSSLLDTKVFKTGGSNFTLRHLLGLGFVGYGGWHLWKVEKAQDKLKESLEAESFAASAKIKVCENCGGTEGQEWGDFDEDSYDEWGYCRWCAAGVDPEDQKTIGLCDDCEGVWTDVDVRVEYTEHGESCSNPKCAGYERRQEAESFSADSFDLETHSGHEVQWDDGSFYMTFKEPIDGYGEANGHWYGGERESPDEILLDVEPAWDEETDDEYDVPSLHIQVSQVEYYGIENHNMSVSPDGVASPELLDAIQEGLAWMVDDHEDKTVVSREYRGESFTYGESSPQHKEGFTPIGVYAVEGVGLCTGVSFAEEQAASSTGKPPVFFEWAYICDTCTYEEDECECGLEAESFGAESICSFENCDEYTLMHMMGYGGAACDVGVVQEMIREGRFDLPTMRYVVSYYERNWGGCDDEVFALLGMTDAYGAESFAAEPKCKECNGLPVYYDDELKFLEGYGEPTLAGLDLDSVDLNIHTLEQLPFKLTDDYATFLFPMWFKPDSKEWKACCDGIQIDIMECVGEGIHYMEEAKENASGGGFYSYGPSIPFYMSGFWVDTKANRGKGEIWALYGGPKLTETEKIAAKLLVTGDIDHEKINAITGEYEDNWQHLYYAHEPTHKDYDASKGPHYINEDILRDLRVLDEKGNKKIIVRSEMDFDGEEVDWDAMHEWDATFLQSLLDKQGEYYGYTLEDFVDLMEATNEAPIVP